MVFLRGFRPIAEGEVESSASSSSDETTRQVTSATGAQDSPDIHNYRDQAKVRIAILPVSSETQHSTSNNNNNNNNEVQYIECNNNNNNIIVVPVKQTMNVIRTSDASSHHETMPTTISSNDSQRQRSSTTVIKSHKSNHTKSTTVPIGGVLNAGFESSGDYEHFEQPSSDLTNVSDHDSESTQSTSGGESYLSAWPQDRLAHMQGAPKQRRAARQRQRQPDVPSSMPPEIPNDGEAEIVERSDENFAITWHNLSYRIAAKWYKRYLHSFENLLSGSDANDSVSNHQLHEHGQTIARQRPPTDQPIEIFNNLNGTIRSGQLTAVLGPSGTGKTTLLNCLTGKYRNGVSGQIQLSGTDKRLSMCTIPQKDHLLELLSVEENLWFASRIKNPERGFDHEANIERVVALLGLDRCRHAKIAKISGGQHKRVSIAQELLSNPDILVLDEPTSGLDSLTCFKTIAVLRDLVELSTSNNSNRLSTSKSGKQLQHRTKPMAIIVTIHQPQLKVFSLFHHVYIMANGGRVIYEGAPSNAMDTVRRVSGLSGAEERAVDPASFLIEIASEEYGVGPIEALSVHQRHLATLDHNNERQANTDEHKQNKSSFYQSNVSNIVVEMTTDTSDGSGKHKQKQNKTNLNENSGIGARFVDVDRDKHRGHFWSHTFTLTHRTLLTIRRDPLLMTSRLMFHLMIPILMSHVYGQATGAANACPHYESEIDITQVPKLVESKRIESMLEELHMSIENVSMFFIIMYAFAAAVLALNALSFPLNMQVLLKETRNGWYSMSSYVVAKTLADLPLELTMPSLTMALVYPLTGQPASPMHWRMATICLIMTLCSLVAQTQALIVGALVMNSVQTAVFVAQASQLPWVILAGFTIRIKRLSEPLKLISLTSFYRLGCEAITLARYGFGICPCDPDEISGEPVRLVGIPESLRSLAQYWLESQGSQSSSVPSDANSTDLVTTRAPPKDDIFQHLANQLSYANSYGVNITSCEDVAPDRIRAINLSDHWLVARIWHLIIMLLVMKLLLYYAVRFSINIRL